MPGDLNAKRRAATGAMANMGNEMIGERLDSTPDLPSGQSAFVIACAWRDLGVSTIPIIPGTKRPAIRWQPFTADLPTCGDLRRWFADGRFGLAVIGGGRNRLTVVDFDTMTAYDQWRVLVGDLATYEVRTRRGRHCYFFTDDATSFDLPGFCEVRGIGRYVLAPPSRHPSGAQYQPVDPSAGILHVPDIRELLPQPEAARADLPIKIPDIPHVASGATVRQVLTAWPILRAAQAVGIEPKSSDGGTGRWFLARCIFHDDHSPSLWLDADRQRFGCYSPQCIAHRSGSSIDLLALARRVTVGEAIREMSAKLPPGAGRDRLPLDIDHITGG